MDKFINSIHPFTIFMVGFTLGALRIVVGTYNKMDRMTKDSENLLCVIEWQRFLNYSSCNGEELIEPTCDLGNYNTAGYLLD